MASMVTNCVRAQLVQTASCPAHWIITFNQSDSYSNAGATTEKFQWPQNNHVLILDVIEHRINEHCTPIVMKEKMWSPPHCIKQQSGCCCTYWVWGVLWAYMKNGYIMEVSTAGTVSSRLLESLVQRQDSPDIAVSHDEDLSGIRWPGSLDQFDFHATPYFIRNTNTDPNPPRALVLQRALCDSKPGLWDGGPGGGVHQDKSLFDVICRETQEETGLQVSRIIQPLSGKRWKRTKQSGMCMSEWVGFPYIVGITEKKEVQLNPKEHQKFAWVTEDEVRTGNYKMLEDQRDTLLEAFSLFPKIIL